MVSITRSAGGALIACAVMASLMSVPQVATAAGAGGKPAVQSTKSVPVGSVKTKASKVKRGPKSVPADNLPKPGTEKLVQLRGDWSEAVAGFSVRAKSHAAPDAGGLTIESVGVTSASGGAGTGPVYRIGPAPDLTPSPESSPKPPANPEPSDGPTPPPAPKITAPSDQSTPDASEGELGQVTKAISVGDEPLELRLDYSSFANSYGGDWAGRLRLVLLDDCDTRSAKVTCKKATPLKTTNDTKTDTLTAVAPSSTAGATTMMVAAAAAASGSQGDYKASSLAPSSSWAAGNQSGDFTWSYPLAVPPGINGPQPDLAVNYSSGSVDGRTSATNNQTSWVGEGFSLDPGFIERSYEPCDQVDGTPDHVGDLCWRDDNLTISLNGQSSELIQDGSSNQWRMKSDDGTRVELLTNDGINRDNNGEYWRVTTSDGTRYYYGRNERFSGDNRKTDSVSTVPVYGAKSGDPCHDSTYASSACDQAWRWGLDYVIDPHDNTMSFFYDQEKNKYGANRNDTVRSYDRSPLLTSIEYGTRVGQDDAPAKVVFSTAERCLPDADFDCGSLTSDTASHWPDVPYDQICSSDTSCADRTAPTFFSRKRLAKITTYVKGESGYNAVNEWTLSHELPATGDVSTDPDLEQRAVRTLWLAQIQQTGKAGTDVSLPPVKFNKQIMDNRVYDTNGVDSFARYRVNAIDNGTGGSIAVNYSGRDCTASSKPSSSSLDTNSRRCFPVWYQPWWSEDPQLEFFHKYRVDSVVEADNTGGGANVTTSYTYSGGDGWHFTSSTIEEPEHRTWNDWRGYSTVRTEVGAESGKTYSDTLFLRGMHGDKAQGGGTKSVTVTDPLGDSPNITDSEQRAGFERRTRTRLGASGNVVDITVNTPWTSDATATSGGKSAYILNVGGTETRTRLSTGLYRTTKTSTTYNDRGQPTAVDDAGDTSTAADNRCTTTAYATNSTNGMFDYPSTQITTALACGSVPTKAADIISATRTSYDGGAPGDAPTKGDPTKVETAAGWTTGILYQIDATSAYDAYGRATSVTNARDETTTTSYNPSTGPVDSITTTNALGQDSVVHPSRAWGSPSRETDVAGGNTDYAYDGLGRVVSIWGPDRDQATQTPTVKYSYRVSATEANAVSTERLNAKENYVKSVAFYDGLMRERSTQTPSAGVDGGRLITDKIYDDRGWVLSSRGPYFNSDSVDTTLVSAAENAIPSYTNYTYDLAGRVTKESLASLGGIKWSTSTSYGGDRVLVTPPTGGTATTTVTDARGQTTSLTQHTAATPTGTGDVTTYTYTPAGQLATVTDASGTKWTKSYDIRGRLSSDVDPDKGTSTFTYDALDRQVTSTDARDVTLWTGYDKLGRKTELRDDDSDGTLRSKWVYDTVRPGALTSSTRYADGGEYTNEVTAYDTAGRPTSSRVLIPESEGLLYRAGGHVTSTSYNPDGSVKRITQPLVYGITNENLNYTYDDLGNVKSLLGATPIVYGNIYAATGELLQRDSGSTSGKSVYDTRNYDQATRRITQRSVSLQGTATTPRMDLRYTYDQAGNVTRLNDVAAGDTAQTSTATWRQCFSYDYLRRMTKAWTSSGTTCAAPTTTNLGSLAPYADTYTYAKNGNRNTAVSLRKPSTSVTSTTRTSTFPAATATRPHAASKTVKTGSSTGTETFSYDEAGNLTKRSTSATAGKSYVWDHEGHVKSVTDLATGKSIDYLYDADGNRLIERDGIDGSTTLNVGTAQMKVKDGVRSTVRTYTLNGEPIATRDASGLHVTEADHHGTPLVSVNSTTQAFIKRRYTPFGEQIQAPASAWPSDKGYLNKTSDASAGTTHLDAREFDSAAGRFISVDPILDAMDPQQMNGYAYANNSPVTASDPDGLMQTCGEGGYCDRDRSASPKMSSGGSGFLGAVGSAANWGWGKAKAGTRNAVDYGRKLANSPDPRGQLGQDILESVADDAEDLGDTWVESCASGNGSFMACKQASGAVGLTIGSFFVGGPMGRFGSKPIVMMLEREAAASAAASQLARSVGTADSAQAIVQSTARAQAALGSRELMKSLSSSERDAMERLPWLRRPMLGQAVHRATARELERNYPGRFVYSTRGPDFLDTTTGKMLELTTPKQVAAHEKRPGYGGVTMCTYELSSC
ncbi:RHS repeat domain-containing protein [Aeromicrobium terrae]|nr:RHS repeat-associated core domain-containing protein [Aeromicrobium terrae]